MIPVGISSGTAFPAGAAAGGWLEWSGGRRSGGLPVESLKGVPLMADLGLIVLTILLFGLLALVLKGVERL